MDDGDDDSVESRVVNFKGGASKGAGFFGLSASGEQRLVDFRLRDGRRTAFAYNDVRFLDFDAEDGMITIEFGPFVVTMAGLGMNVLYEGLFERRVRWLRESQEEEADDVVDGVRIDFIHLAPPSPLTLIAEFPLPDREG